MQNSSHAFPTEASEQWTLDEFAAVANDLLPQVLPEAKTNAKLCEDITPRLIRYYANQGVLDDPLREGKFAFYNRRHLLQLLVCRRLLVEGFTVAVIVAIASHKTDSELESMLTDGIEFHLSSARLSAPVVPATIATVSEQWHHLQIQDGIELHVRADVALPQTALEYQRLLNAVKLALQNSLTSRN